MHLEEAKNQSQGININTPNAIIEAQAVPMLSTILPRGGAWLHGRQGPCHLVQLRFPIATKSLRTRHVFHGAIVSSQKRLPMAVNGPKLDSANGPITQTVKGTKLYQSTVRKSTSQLSETRPARQNPTNTDTGQKGRRQMTIIPHETTLPTRRRNPEDELHSFVCRGQLVDGEGC